MVVRSFIRSIILLFMIHDAYFESSVVTSDVNDAQI